MCLTYKGHNEKNYIIISMDTKHDLNKIKYLFVKKTKPKICGYSFSKHFSPQLDILLSVENQS